MKLYEKKKRSESENREKLYKDERKNIIEIKEKDEQGEEREQIIDRDERGK